MRPHRIMRLLLLLPVGLCLSCHSGKTLVDEIEKTRQAGLPTTPKELQAPLPPNSQNAAPLYRQLGALLKSKPLSDDDKIAGAGVGRRRITEDQAAPLRRAYARRGDIGNLVRQAAEMPQCVFDRDWEQGADLLLPEYATMRLAARWLSGESALLLYYGRTTEAIETQALGFHIASQAAKDPTLIAFLVGDAVDAITLAGMERILYEAGNKASVAEAVAQAIEKNWEPHSLAYGMRGEINMDLVEIEKLRTAGPSKLAQMIQGLDGNSGSQALKVPPVTQQNWDRFLNDNGVNLLQHWRIMIASADKPYPESAKAMKEILQDLDAHRSDMNYLLLNVLLPTVDQTVDKKAHIEAIAACDLTGARVLAWKDRHGKFPEKLEEALKTIPADPFDGKPIRYKKEGSGFVVYSVGRNGDFDGGDVNTKPDQAKETLFRYPIPEYIK